ncbi:MAG: glycosyltransferase family 4 protein [Pseudomonadaceae bacterium]|nr:glycosyltransferase family 4 protein [Pseudomonadaceae bacterium]
MDAAGYDFCLFGPKCYSYLAGEADARYIGGIERDLVRIASILASRYRVAFLTFADADTRRFTTRDGVDVVPVYDPEAGLPKVRLLHPRLTSMVMTARELKPRVFIQMGGGEDSLLTVSAARASGAKSVFLIGSDSDCDGQHQLVYSGLERALYRAALPRFDSYFAQTDAQRSLAQEHHGIDAQVLRTPSVDLGFVERGQDVRSVLWVGRIDPIKRAEWLVDAAAQLPEVSFHLVGAANASGDYDAAIERKARALTNVTWHGRKNLDELRDLYRQATYLLSTSIQEGFPRTFLEAWSTGLPTLSSFDPDGVIAEHGLGLHYHSVDELVTRLSASDEDYEQLSQRCREFYENYYSDSAAEAALLAAFEALLA